MFKVIWQKATSPPLTSLCIVSTVYSWPAHVPVKSGFLVLRESASKAHLDLFIFPPSTWERSIVMSVYVCVCVSALLYNVQSMSADRNDPYIKQLAGGVMGPGIRGVDRSVEEDLGNTVVDQHPLSCIKLKLFGNCAAGKTTLVDSLRCGYIRALFRQLSRPKQGQGQGQGHTDVEGGTGDDHEGCTRCIDVRHISISGRLLEKYSFAVLDIKHKIYDELKYRSSLIYSPV